MTFNVGIDIEEVSRFENKDKTLLEKIFSKSELKKMKSYNARHLAGMFSAKEAVIKALHHLPNFKALPLSKIEIERSENGAPRVTLPKTFKSLKIYLSMSHCGEYALAFVVVEKIIE